MTDHTEPAPEVTGGSNAGPIAAERLKSFIERIERLDEEKGAIAADIKEVYSEAKSAGFDTKIMRRVIRERKLSKEDREEQEQLLDVYRQALGMIADTALGRAAIERKAAALTGGAGG